MINSFRGFGHIALRVTDLARSKAFYSDTLGLPVLIERGDRILVNVYGIPLGLVGADTHTPSNDRFDPYRVGLDHLALSVPDKETLQTLLQNLNQASIPNNGIEDDPMTGGTYISFYDPDGIAWEFYVVPAQPNRG